MFSGLYYARSLALPALINIGSWLVMTMAVATDPATTAMPVTSNPCDLDARTVSRRLINQAGHPGIPWSSGGSSRCWTRRLMSV